MVEFVSFFTNSVINLPGTTVSPSLLTVALIFFSIESSVSVAERMSKLSSATIFIRGDLRSLALTKTNFQNHDLSLNYQKKRL